MRAAISRSVSSPGVTPSGTVWWRGRGRVREFALRVARYRDGVHRGSYGRWKSHVRGLPEVFGELPAVCLAEEIETPGRGQVRALITIAGNPALSTPNSARLQQSLGMLDYMVSVDMYLNETTRYANVILPPPPTLAHSHYDLALYQLAVHNVAHYSAPVLEREPGMVTTPHGSSRGLLSSTGLPAETVPEGHALAFDKMFFAALTSRSAT